MTQTLSTKIKNKNQSLSKRGKDRVCGGNANLEPPWKNTRAVCVLITITIIIVISLVYTSIYREGHFGQDINFQRLGPFWPGLQPTVEGHFGQDINFQRLGPFWPGLQHTVGGHFGQSIN